MSRIFPQILQIFITNTKKICVYQRNLRELFFYKLEYSNKRIKLIATLSIYRE